MEYPAPFSHIPTYCIGTNLLQVVIHTPKNGRNSYAYNTEYNTWELATVLPPQSIFPCDIGYIPQTWSYTKQCIETFVLADEPTFSGCLVQAHLLGAIQMRVLNSDTDLFDIEYLIAAATTSHHYGAYTQLQQLDSTLLDTLEHFLTTHNNNKGFSPVARLGASAAKAIVFEGQIRYKKLPIKSFRRSRRKGRGGSSRL